MKILQTNDDLLPYFSTFHRGIYTFTSLVSDDAQFIFLDEHLERLTRGGDYLFPEHCWSEKQHEIKEFLLKHFRGNSYFRLTLVEDTLLFYVKEHEFKPMELAICGGVKYPAPFPTYLKIPNYLYAHKELIQAKSNGFDDILFFDPSGRALEASTSNLFVIMGRDLILTPKIQEGVLEGVTRKKLINYFLGKRIKVEETFIEKDVILNAKEMWLSNAVQGVRFVHKYEKTTYARENSLYDELLAGFGRFGEQVK